MQNSNDGQRFLKCLETNAKYYAAIQETIRANPRPADEVFTLASSDEFETGILSTLWFAEMQSRGQTICEPVEGTFQWIFQEPQPNQVRWTSFVDWLRKDSNEHIYWITGKAGAGKSTLMKFICSHGNTDKISREWATNKKLIQAQCYIGNCDVPVQISKKRLLRTLLYECLRQDQRLIATSFPVQWEMLTLLGIRPDYPMTELELQEALERMVEYNVDTRFVFYVDGLDELEEDANTLVAMFKKLALNSNIKICLSSRTRVKLRDSFGVGPSLRLEDLNRPDIIQFAQASLDTSTDFVRLRTMSTKQAQAQALVEAIADKATGALLWVRIVVGMLLQGLQDGERLSDLCKRVESAPSGLEPLFDKMLDSIGPERIEHASQIFQIIRAAKAPVDLLSLSFADEEDVAIPYEYPAEPLTQDQEEEQSEQMRRRLHTHCKGFLQVSPTTTTSRAATTVDHLHRTVRDFLHRPDIWTRLTSNRTLFNPHLSLAHASLLRLRSSPLTPAQYHSHNLLHAPDGSLAALVVSATNHLSTLDRETAEFHTHLWDALARTTNALVQRAGLCTSGTGCWCRGAADHPDGPFLALAVRVRALPYIEYRLGRTWMRVQEEKLESGAAPVLWFAVTSVGLDEEFARDGEGEEDEDRMRLIGLLLEWGADPNFVAGAPRSPWEEVVEGGGVEEYGIDVWEELLRYGADRKVVGLVRGSGEVAGTGEKRKRRWMRRVWRREDGSKRWKRKD